MFDSNTCNEMSMDAEQLLRAAATTKVPHSQTFVITY